jgi:hypothetical protein
MLSEYLGGRGKMLECFRFVENKSDMVQVVLTGGMEPIRMNPREIADISQAASVPSVFERIPNVISHLLDRGANTKVTLWRTYAAGDVLMLVPVVKYLEERYGLDVSMKTWDPFGETVSLLGVRVVNRPVGLTVCLDGVVEHDHALKECQKYHRVELYLRALGMEGGFEPRDLNWDCNLANFGYQVVDGDYIVFQGAGSTRNKSLRPAAISEALRILSARYKVAYIGSEKDIERIDGVFYTGYRYSFVQLFNIIGLAKCLVCMDSAPLWISHFTKTPVIAVLGPTPARNRISFHPLYEEGAKAVQLNDALGCQSCFERAAACNSKYRCLDVSGEELCGRIGGYVEEFARG